MSNARFIIGDSLTVLRSMPESSVHCVVTSPPYLGQRSYLPDDDPAKDDEIGQEPSPGDFLAALLELMDELWRVLRDDGTFFVNLGDKASGSGGAGGDYNDGGMREGQNKYPKVKSGGEWPKAKSVCWVPSLFGASLAYGRNLLTGNECRQWVTRPPVTWCKPNPGVGDIFDKFREATELIVWGAKQGKYYFDLDSIREAPARDYSDEKPTKPNREADRNGHGRKNTTRESVANPLGVPPLNYWTVPPAQYKGAHYATFPPDLIKRPIIAGCPPGGVVLDPFAGSGTTLAVATGHGREAIGIDIDERNADQARQRVGMFLEVEDSRIVDEIPA